MPYIDLGELQLFYEEIGYGEPVLFLHSGYSRGILAFSGQLQPFMRRDTAAFIRISGGMAGPCAKVWNGILR